LFGPRRLWHPSGKRCLHGTTTVNAVHGVAASGTSTVDTAGKVALAIAASPGTRAGSPARVAFLVQPRNTTAGTTMAPPITVAVQDSAGNTLADATNAITVAIGTNPRRGILSGTMVASPAAASPHSQT